MENASKALIMAGSILMALMIIAVVLFMYNQLAGIQQEKASADETSKLAEYGKKFEQYNKAIYGSELLSLANLQEDYKKTQADIKGYEEITIKIKIKTSIIENGKSYLEASDSYVNISILRDNIISKNKKISNITQDTTLADDITYYETKKTYTVGKTTKTIKEYSQMSRREIAKLGGTDVSSSEHDYDIEIQRRFRRID